ncbi:hypothetical protein E2562_007939, partial [Oryza meyeriana var. granulata]
MEPMASEPSVPKGTASADLLLQETESPSLWDDLTGMFRKAFHRRGADKRFTLSVCMMSVLHGLFPILDWWKSYSLKFFRSDLMSGLTLASLSIPQSIGYATLAKLDPQYGLYTSVVPPLVYAVTGTSREIAIGPVAIVSLLLSLMIQKVVDPAVDPASYRKMVFTVTFLTGVFQFAFAINGYRLDGNKEMVAMGFMNIAGSLSSCYVATGSFSRTAVNFAAGCKTTVSNIIMAATVMVALELLTKFLYYTPVSILASIILSSLPGLINVQEVCFLWKVDKMDFLTCMGSFLGVLFGSVEIGLSVALVVSFAKIIIQSIRPQVEILGRLRGTDIFCSIKQYPVVHQTPTVLTIRIETSFFCFVNASFIKEKIMGWVTNKREAFCSVVLDISNVVNMDTSGLAALGELHKQLSWHP